MQFRTRSIDSCQLDMWSRYIDSRCKYLTNKVRCPKPATVANLSVTLIEDPDIPSADSSQQTMNPPWQKQTARLSRFRITLFYLFFYFYLFIFFAKHNRETKVSLAIIHIIQEKTSGNAQIKMIWHQNKTFPCKINSRCPKRCNYRSPHINVKC